MWFSAEEIKKLVVALSVLSIIASVAVGANDGVDFTSSFSSSAPRFVNLGDLEETKGQVILGVDLFFDRLRNWRQ